MAQGTREAGLRRCVLCVGVCCHPLQWWCMGGRSETAGALDLWVVVVVVGGLVL